MHRLLAHTADLRAELEAADFDALCAEAVALVREILVGESPVLPRAERFVKLEGTEEGERFFRFVRELVYLADAEGFLPASCACSDGGFRVAGEPFDPLAPCRPPPAQGVDPPPLRLRARRPDRAGSSGHPGGPAGRRGERRSPRRRPARRAALRPVKSSSGHALPALERIDDFRWRIAAARCDADRRADLRLRRARSEDLESDEALRQVANVACLPGIVGPSIAMPDIHWGYGFPIGGVAAFDPERRRDLARRRRLRHQLRRAPADHAARGRRCCARACASSSTSSSPPSPRASGRRAPTSG